MIPKATYSSTPAPTPPEPIILVFFLFSHSNWSIKYLSSSITSEVPVEHESLKLGRDGTRRDVTGWDTRGHNGTRRDNNGRHWKDRREGWIIYVDQFFDSKKHISLYPMPPRTPKVPKAPRAQKAPRAIKVPKALSRHFPKKPNFQKFLAPKVLETFHYQSYDPLKPHI